MDFLFSFFVGFDLGFERRAFVVASINHCKFVTINPFLSTQMSTLALQDFLPIFLGLPFQLLNSTGPLAVVYEHPKEDSLSILSGEEFSFAIPEASKYSPSQNCQVWGKF